jgi:hypothetical protein
MQPWLKLALEGDGQKLYALADDQPVKLLRPRGHQQQKKMVSHEQQVKTNQVKALVAMANADCLESLHKCWQKQISKRLTLGPGGCWLANYAANKKGEHGYSQVSIKSTKYMAHTISLLLWKREIDGQLPSPTFAINPSVSTLNTSSRYCLNHCHSPPCLTSHTCTGGWPGQ